LQQELLNNISFHKLVFKNKQKIDLRMLFLHNDLALFAKLLKGCLAKVNKSVDILVISKRCIVLLYQLQNRVKFNCLLNNFEPYDYALFEMRMNKGFD